jgi:GTP cyclohydrolase I
MWVKLDSTERIAMDLREHFQEDHVESICVPTEPTGAIDPDRSVVSDVSSHLQGVKCGEREAIAQAASLILKAVGESPEREGLLRTPVRFAKAYESLCQGYQVSAREACGQGIFQAEGKGLVSVKDIEFYSLCEHHMLPFWGKVTVAYYPDSKILGLSKIPRIVEVFARRLQVQERITEQVADALMELINPRAVAVKIESRHLCMMMRGVKTQHSETSTETFRGLGNLNPQELDRMMAQLGN